MIKNYIRTAFRYFNRNKVSTLINILGLSVGISSALIIFMIIKYDKSFDQYEPDGARTYRVVSDGDYKNNGVPVPFAEALKHNISGIQTVAALFDYNDWNAKVLIPQGNTVPDKLFKKQKGIVYADAGYFDLFPHKWLAGKPASAFNNVYNLVLTESTAQTYFPGVAPQDVIGKTVIFSDTVRTTVTGVVADLTAKSDFDKQCFISLTTVYNTSLKRNFQADQWGSVNSGNQVFVKLNPNVKAATVNREISGIYKQHNRGSKSRPELQALANIHTNPDFGGSVDPVVLRNLAILAIFLLTLGAINFINLSTAQASERAKEIGIRKTLGSGKGQLMAQFLSETFILTFITALISTGLAPLILKVFSGFVPEGLDTGYLFKEPVVWLFLFVLVIGVSLVAGLYPAFVMSAFRPVSVLKNKNVSAAGSAWLRKSLIVSQFIIAQVFVIGVLVVDKQLHFAELKDMGFRKDAIINFYVPFGNDKINQKILLRQQLASIPGIQAVSLGNQTPAFNGSMSTEISYKEKGKDIDLAVNSRDGDTSYLRVYQIPLVAGRKVTMSDTTNQLLINETLAKQIGFENPADAVGHFVKYGSGEVPVVGVMKDFNQASVRTTVAPMVFFYSPPKFGYVMHVALQTNPATWNKTIQKITAVWHGIYPDVDFDYTFLDKEVESFYKTDRQLSLLLTWSAGIAIFISCLGMLGLIIFITNKRVKEIGVRKVLGASVPQIVTLLAADFARLLVLAFVIAVPLAWWQTHKWLQNFAYHTALSWWLFAAGGVLMIATALIIVSIRAGKAALANPADSLRTE